MLSRSTITSIFALALLSACASHAPDIDTTAKKTDSEPARSAITLGDGQKNWIVVDGVTRDAATLTFREVHINGNGWLVLHAFKDGKPMGKVYAAATYIVSGTNLDVAISLAETPAPGTPFIVMLHRDVNENQEFDFTFVDDRNVLDKAVFEGTTMIAHRVVTP